MNNPAQNFVDDTVEIERAAKLPVFEYERDREAIAERLGVRATVLDAEVKKARGKKAHKPAAPLIDPDTLANSAGHIIQSQNILDLFAKDLSKVIAGEEVNGKLLYLVATSRLFAKPMNAAIKGTSAGGKSEIRKRILAFFPPEDVVTFTSLSEKALIYFDGDFSHKILSMGEATATEEKQFQDYLLRELMSEGQIRHSAPQKIGNEIQTVTIEKHGPVAFLVTTTQNLLHAENETRMLSLEIDDTQGQTKKVLKKIAQVVGLQNAPSVDYNPWQDFQRWLGTGERRVVVPFAGALADLMEALAVRLRRDFGQILAAIQAHALLHREQRGRDESGRIVADIDHDYAAIRELMSAIVAEGSGANIKKEVVETIEAVTKATVGMDEKDGATAKDIAKLLKLDKSAARRRLISACDGDYVINLEARKGMPGKYRVTDQKVDSIDILPASAKLIDAYASVPLLKSLPPCHRDGKPDADQGDIGGKTGGKPVAGGNGGKPVANDLATDNALNGNEESPPVARWHGFSEIHREESHNGGAFRSDIEDAHEELREREKPVCEQCGKVGGGEATPFAYGEHSAQALHPHCRHEWLVANGVDLDIPAALRRGPQ